MTLANRIGSMNEGDPFSRLTDFYAQPTLPMFWDGDVPPTVNPREQSQLPRSNDAAMASLNLDFDLSNELLMTYNYTRKLLKWLDWVTPNTRFMGTRVRGQMMDRLLPAMVVSEKMHDCAFRATQC
jgi:hypothetical protein